ncbi:MAG: ketoacyl-ACP synthase III [Acidobacteria bacterium]|nr:ketoacyl-ACP synthase III [Acidobacteriota bacterium]
MKPASRIRSLGSCLPPKVLTNAELEKIVETSDEWIRTRTGIRERHISGPDEYSSVLATRAAELALHRAGMTGADLDMIVCCTISPDQPLPATGCIVQSNLKATKAVAFDIAAACSGFLYGLSIADQFIRTGKAKNILVIGVEVLSRYVDYTDRATCVIFGDGAGAAVVTPADSDSGIYSTQIRSDGSLAEFLYIPGGGTHYPATHHSIDDRLHYIKMKGNELFKVAVRSMDEISRKVLDDAGMRAGDIDLLVPHQANQRISEAVRERLGVPTERIYANIDRIGNTSSASIPIALDELYTQGRLKEGMNLLLVSFGAGVTWGGALIKW